MKEVVLINSYPLLWTTQFFSNKFKLHNHVHLLLDHLNLKILESQALINWQQMFELLSQSIFNQSCQNDVDRVPKQYFYFTNYFLPHHLMQYH